MIDYPVPPAPGPSPDRPGDPPVPAGAPSEPAPATGASAGGAGYEPAAPTKPAPAPQAPRRGSSSRSTSILLGVAAIIAVGGIAFAVGRMTAPTASAATGRFGTGNFGGAAREFGPTASFAPGEGRVGAFGGTLPGIGGAAGIAIDGTVQSVSGSSMTVKTSSGQTVTVDLGPSTTYHTATSASASSVKPGSSVRVQLQLDRTGFAGGAGTTGGTGAVPSPLPSGATRTLNASDVTVVNP